MNKVILFDFYKENSTACIDSCNQTSALKNRSDFNHVRRNISSPLGKSVWADAGTIALRLLNEKIK